MNTLLSLAALVAAAAQPAAQADVSRGYRVYVDQKCSACHSVAGYGNTAVPLDDVASRLSDADIREWLVAPDVMREKTKSEKKPPMPGYGKLSARDIDALIAYLKTLKAP